MFYVTIKLGSAWSSGEAFFMSDKEPVSDSVSSDERGGIGYLANIPPFSWILRQIARSATRRAVRSNGNHRDFAAVADAPALDDTRETRPAVKVGGSSLEDILNGIVYDVVEALGYVGAMVATLESGDELPVRAYHIHEKLVSKSQIHAWEKRLSNLAGRPISLGDPSVARVKLQDPNYAKNLSVRAALAQRPVPSGDLYALFRPIVPYSGKPVVEGIQQELGIRHVVAVPFFLSVEFGGEIRKELVGNLFVASKKAVSAADIRLLAAFARQAAAAIESENRRQQWRVMEQLFSAAHMNIQQEQVILQEISQGVVRELNFVGAIVASYEPADRSLPVRAYHIDPSIATAAQVERWEKVLASLPGVPDGLSLTNPEVARVELDRQYHRDNLSVKAVRAAHPVQSDALYDLLKPFVPLAGKPIVDGIQQELGIQRVIAVPFYVESEGSRVLMGNLFGATRSTTFGGREVEMLQAFGQQAAIGIRNARLYQQAEQRRVVAQTLGMEAFTSSVHVHELRSLVTPARGWIDLLSHKKIKNPDDYRQFYKQYMSKVAPLVSNFDEMTRIIDTLRQPWRYRAQRSTNFHDCLSHAINKGVDRVIRLHDRKNIDIRVDTQDVMDDLPLISTSEDMLSQALAIVLQNSTEAIIQAGGQGIIDIHAVFADGYLDVQVRDNGVGIKQRDLRKAFEQHFTTKDESHRGFGLYWTKDYIEGLGGIVRLMSRHNEGTIVQIRLPIPPKRDATAEHFAIRNGS